MDFGADEWQVKERGMKQGVRTTDEGTGPEQVWGKIDALAGNSDAVSIVPWCKEASAKNPFLEPICMASPPTIPSESINNFSH